MDSNSLRTFIVSAETGSFSRAADNLYLTQPAVSKRIAALEAELNTRLFDRIGRELHLTEAGELLLPRARQLLQDWRDSLTVVANLSREIRGALRLATSHHIGLHRLPPLLKRYRRHYPQVDIQLRFLNSESACEAVLNGELELALVTLPSGLQATQQANLAQQTIWPDPLSIAIAVDYEHLQELTDSENEAARLASLCQLPAILPERNTFTRQIVEAAFQRKGQAIRVELSTNYLETIKMLVKVGLGWSVLPRSMLDDDLHVLHCPGMDLQRNLGVVRHRQRSLSNATRTMLQLLERECPS